MNKSGVKKNEHAIRRTLSLHMKGEFSKIMVKKDKDLNNICEEPSFTSIICLDFLSREQQVFSQNGKLINTFNFTELCN